MFFVHGPLKSASAPHTGTYQELGLFVAQFPRRAGFGRAHENHLWPAGEAETGRDVLGRGAGSVQPRLRPKTMGTYSGANKTGMWTGGMEPDFGHFWGLVLQALQLLHAVNISCCTTQRHHWH